ncbi:hypothetical protein QYE76_005790 [Lolium multiflorum]|uniref:Uncharacterized protein n=1 Tax=Lolium multiflorum TaxID=4521 RepID=A0AAD8RTM7_LOLMU|nr:hypothetical protein QYE76_005790 [Lolium multiflorum]
MNSRPLPLPHIPSHLPPRQRGTEAAAAWSGDGQSSAEKVSGGWAAATAGSSSSSWTAMARERGGPAWSTGQAPAGPLQLRLVVTGGYDGKWVWADGEVIPRWCAAAIVCCTTCWSPVRANLNLCCRANATSATAVGGAEVVEQVEALEEQHGRAAGRRCMPGSSSTVGDEADGDPRCQGVPDPPASTGARHGCRVVVARAEVSTSFYDIGI